MKFWSATKAEYKHDVTHHHYHVQITVWVVWGEFRNACQHINIQEIFELIQDVVQCQFMHINEGLYTVFGKGALYLSTGLFELI